LQLTPVDTNVKMTHRYTYKTLKTVEDCHLFATLEVVKGEKDSG